MIVLGTWRHLCTYISKVNHKSFSKYKRCGLQFAVLDLRLNYDAYDVCPSAVSCATASTCFCTWFRSVEQLGAGEIDVTTFSFPMKVFTLEGYICKQNPCFWRKNNAQVVVLSLCMSWVGFLFFIKIWLDHYSDEKQLMQLSIWTFCANLWQYKCTRGT